MQECLKNRELPTCSSMWLTMRSPFDVTNTKILNKRGNLLVLIETKLFSYHSYSYWEIKNNHTSTNKNS